MVVVLTGARKLRNGLKAKPKKCSIVSQLSSNKS